MSDINSVIMIGRLTRDPELKYTPSGSAVATMTIAVGRKYKKAEEMVDEVCFIDVVVWNKLAEVAGKYLAKGSRIGVTGRLMQRTWQTKEGDKRSKHEIFGESVQFLSEKKETESKSEPKSTDEHDDVPF
mgnify:FL=1